MSKVRSGTSLSSLAGEDFGPYRLVRRLGVGGMAETYEAIRRGPSGFTQHVCLKLVLPFFRDNEDFIQLFEREARLAAKLRHSNIVGVIDFGEFEGIPYMALELVDGADLRILLDGQDGKRLPHELVALLGSDIASALEHAHAPRRSQPDGGNVIVHRDVSPSNVLISRRGEVFLSDFGVAKAISGTSRKQSAVKGKVPYMSPEQLRAEALDGRADLFALGVVLFEALGGQRPYEGPHDPATIMLTLSGDHPSLQGLAPGAPARLCEVVESLIHPDRTHRPDDASVLIDLLDEFVPSPRARRGLGTMVDQCRPPEPRISTQDALGAIEDDEPDREPAKVTTGVQPTGGVAASAPTAPLGSKGPTANEAGERSRWGRIAGAIILIGALVSLAVAFRPGVEPSAVESTETETDIEAAETAPAEELAEPRTDVVANPAGAEPEPEPPVEPTATEVAEKTQPTPEAATPPPARLTVIVFPWGNVWINGKPRGPAPLKNEPLKAGRYRISVGQDAPFESRTIRLRPGQRRTLDFDLTK